MLPHRVAAVGPRQRHGDLATHPAGAHEHRVPGPELGVANLQPLTDQRVERVRDDDETQIVTAQPVTMPPPSESPTAAYRLVVSGSPPDAPAPGDTDPREGHGVTRAACGPRRSPPPRPR